MLLLVKKAFRVKWHIQHHDFSDRAGVRDWDKGFRIGVLRLALFFLLFDPASI